MPVHNLPAQLTSFVGRDQEVAELGKLLGETRRPEQLTNITLTSGRAARSHDRAA